ncbi:MAG: RNA polymerase sigma factor [Thermoguttaceae bacterium]
MLLLQTGKGLGSFHYQYRKAMYCERKGLCSVSENKFNSNENFAYANESALQNKEFSGGETSRESQFGADISNYANFAEWSDEDLLLEYRKIGNRYLFEELVNRYETKLFAYLRRYIGNTEDAEDAFQMAFFQVHKNCDKFEEGRKFLPWLYTIAINVAIDNNRKKQQKPTLSIDYIYGSNDDSAFDLANVLEDQDAGPAEKTQDLEEKELLHKAIQTLPEVSQQIIHLVYFKGLTYREAATLLDIPFGTVKSKIKVAFDTIGKILKGVIFLARVGANSRHAVQA